VIISEADLKVQVLEWLIDIILEVQRTCENTIAGLQQVTGDYVYLVVPYNISPVASVLHHGWNSKIFCYISPIFTPRKQQWPMGVVKQK